jgi:hypothetical protein
MQAPPLDLERERNHIRQGLSAGAKFNSLLALATGLALLTFYVAPAHADAEALKRMSEMRLKMCPGDKSTLFTLTCP